MMFKTSCNNRAGASRWWQADKSMALSLPVKARLLQFVLLWIHAFSRGKQVAATVQADASFPTTFLQSILVIQPQARLL